MHTTYYATRQIYLSETLDYKNAVLAAGGFNEQLWTIDSRIRLLKSIGCWEKLDQYIDARFGTTVNANSELTRAYSLRGQSTDPPEAASTAGKATWVRFDPELNQAVFDHTNQNTVVKAGTVTIAREQDYTIGVRVKLLNNTGSQMFGARYNTPNGDYWIVIDRTAILYVHSTQQGLTNSGGTYTLPVGTWVFIWIVKVGSTLNVYVNDALIFSNPVDFDMPQVGWYIGGEPGYGYQQMRWQSCFRAKQALTLEQRNALQL